GARAAVQGLSATVCHDATVAAQGCEENRGGGKTSAGGAPQGEGGGTTTGAEQQRWAGAIGWRLVVVAFWRRPSRQGRQTLRRRSATFGANELACRPRRAYPGAKVGIAGSVIGSPGGHWPTPAVSGRDGPAATKMSASPALAVRRKV